MTGFVVISGCSAGGKSTLLEELARRGHATVLEPGRRVVQDELASGGSALPWADTGAFVDRIVALAKSDFDTASGNTGWTFFDRGLVDAVSALAEMNEIPISREHVAEYRYHHRVFLAPPWPDLYVIDAERRHGIAEAEVEYHRLCRDYPALGYEIVLLPRATVAERADFIERFLAAGP